MAKVPTDVICTSHIRNSAAFKHFKGGNMNFLDLVEILRTPDFSDLMGTFKNKFGSKYFIHCNDYHWKFKRRLKNLIPIPRES